MILSDRSIREAIAAGRLRLEPFDDRLVQPASIDVRLDRYFRVFRNHTRSVIDVRESQADLTELVEIGDDESFVLHPGEFVLGSTLERLSLPDDLVGRVEGKSSLGRLGLLIHSSLPASEPLLVRDASGLNLRTIGEVVKERAPCQVVAFDPDTFEIGYHDVTGFYEGPEDRIFEVGLASGRSVRVTAGHNLFTLDRDGEIHKVRTGELRVGTMIAVPGRVPEPPDAEASIDVIRLIPEAARQRVMLRGPTIARAFREHGNEIRSLLGDAGYRSFTYYRRIDRLPWTVAAQLPGLVDALGEGDRVSRSGERHTLPVRLLIDEELAWTIGMYIAEGYRRAKQVVVSNTDPVRLDRLQAAFASLGLPVYRSSGAVTCCSSLISDLLGWVGVGGRAASKRLPSIVFGWPDVLVRALLQGVVDGDGSQAGGRTSIWTTSPDLVSDLVLLMTRVQPEPAERVDPITRGDLRWDRVVSVVDTGRIEPIYDIEVRPGGRRIENFVAGSGGVFVSNTAGFIDPGFDGHITLELSNVANLPITLHPGMKIGQISFLRMTTPADVPYGSGALGSKYQGQHGPTPSRYFENFD